MIFYVYLLYTPTGEPSGFAVCSEVQYPMDHHVLVGQADTQEKAEALAEGLFADELIEWSLKP